MTTLFMYRAAIFALLSSFTALVAAAPLVLESPDKNLRLHVNIEKDITWSLDYRGKQVITPSKIGLHIKGDGNIAHDIVVKHIARTEVESELKPAVRHKSAVIPEHYREMAINFHNNYGVQFRAYNDGIAYRFVGNRDAEIIVEQEEMQLNFAKGATTLFPEEETLISHFERSYVAETVANINKKRFASLPAYIAVDDVNIVFTEADLFDYPGLFLYGTGKNGFRAGFPGVVTKATPKKGTEDRDQDVEFAKHIAETTGKRSFPWRVAVVSDDDGALIESQLVYLLSRENQIEDTSWIKPGRIAWDWYNANNIYGVDFKSGLNTETYKYYIDFAAKYGLEYVILDEGWTKSTTNILENNPDMDVHELIAYGKEKGVGIILWALWGPLDKDFENILATYAQWGVKGIKIDFMQRADQYMVNYYEKIARAAAKHKLLVNYHGGFKPAGLRRAYPNVMTYEGVKGNENNKWSADITPEHTVTLPFIRMVAGPMDFTPGSMVNVQPSNFNISHYRPMSMGTRAHQVAMYAVYESALQMYCESPSTYYREHETTDFIAAFPSVWDETKVLAADIGNYVMVARRSGKQWFIGAMTDGTARELTVDFSFLDKGNYKLDYFRDGVNTEHYAPDYKREQRDIKAGDSMTIKLAAGGGWAAIITPK